MIPMLKCRELFFLRWDDCSASGLFACTTGVDVSEGDGEAKDLNIKTHIDN